jgi:protein required for attachment to host cells
MQWVLVANASKARIFARTAAGRPLKELEDLVHPASRLHARDLTSDRDGRQGASGGRVHAVQQKTDAKETEAINFARELVAKLESGRDSGKFEALVLVAPPHFLGILRKQIGGPLSAKVVHSIEKNLVSADLHTLAVELAQS